MTLSDVFLKCLEYAHEYEKPFLFHDEIAEILRSAPNGAEVRIDNYDTAPECETYYYTLVRSAGCTRFVNHKNHTAVPASNMIEIIYDTLQVGDDVFIDNTIIFNY
jgi:hypothetical protein